MNISVNIGKLKFKNPVTVASGIFGHAEKYYKLKEVKKLGELIIINLFVFFYILLGVCSADSPPSYGHFSVPSANHLYVAKVKSKEESPKNFILTVLKSDGSKLWEVDFNYNGYPRGIYVSNDGQSVVRINHWDSEYYGALLFYHNGQLIKVWKEKEVPFNRSKIRQTVSHYFWLMTPAILDEMGYGQIIRKKEDGTLEIVYNKVELHSMSQDDQFFSLTTIDGQRHTFNLTTGALVSTDENWLQNRIREWAPVRN